MAYSVSGMPSLIIPSGASTSNAIQDFGDAYGITIFSPATLTDVITVEVEPSSSGTNFITLQSGGIDVTLPASKATVISPVPFLQLRLRSSSVEGQTDVFKVNKVWFI